MSDKEIVSCCDTCKVPHSYDTCTVNTGIWLPTSNCKYYIPVNPIKKECEVSIMGDCYKDKLPFVIGSGSGTYVTNVYFQNDSKHSTDFHFIHCNYSGFKGTQLSWSESTINISVIVSDDYLPVDHLKAYSNYGCFELILKHVPTAVLMNCIQRLRDVSFEDGKDAMKKQFRELLGV